MRALNRQHDTPMFVPDFMASSIFDIDFKLLKKQGIKYIAFDADSTLVSSRGKKMEEKAKLYLQRELKIFDGTCIASNRITNDLGDIGEDLNAKVIRASLLIRKPARGFFARVIDHFQAKPSEIAMVGDKLVADIYGANRSGLKAVWVDKMGKDNILDRLFHTRHIEARMMRKYTKS